MFLSCTLALALTAYCLAGTHDAVGEQADVDEVEALSLYMNEIYVAPELTNKVPSGN